MARAQARTVYLTYGAGFGFATRLMWTTYIVFATVELGLDPLQLVLLGTVLETTYLLLEVPTGVIADTVSRRLSVVLGVIGSGIAFLVLGMSAGFVGAVVSQVLWGLFATLESGADVAWLADEVGEEEAQRLYVVGDQVWHAGAIVGTVAGVAIAIVAGTRVPVLVGAVAILLLGVWMAFAMPERGFTKPERAEGASRSGELIRTFRGGVAEVRRHHVLGLILVVALLYGMASEGWDRLSDLKVVTGVGLDPTGGTRTFVTLGVLELVSILLGLGLLTYEKRKVHLHGHARIARILRVIDAAMFVAVIVFAITGNLVVALVTSWIVGGLRSVREPIVTAWVNQGLDPATRATVNSMTTQVHAVGEASAGPVLGAIGNRSVPLALAVSGVLRLPALLLYRRAIRRGSVGTAAPGDEELTLDDDEATGPIDSDGDVTEP
jgi:MFS transporter, DHA3 family, tetracycline resistance protein